MTTLTQDVDLTIEEIVAQDTCPEMMRLDPDYEQLTAISGLPAYIFGRRADSGSVAIADTYWIATFLGVSLLVLPKGA